MDITTYLRLLLITALAILAVTLNAIWHYRRRATMTPAQREKEDQELREEAGFL